MCLQTDAQWHATRVQGRCLRVVRFGVGRMGAWAKVESLSRLDVGAVQTRAQSMFFEVTSGGNKQLESGGRTQQ